MEKMCDAEWRALKSLSCSIMLDNISEFYRFKREFRNIKKVVSNTNTTSKIYKEAIRKFYEWMLWLSETGGSDLSKSEIKNIRSELEVHKPSIKEIEFYEHKIFETWRCYFLDIPTPLNMDQEMRLNKLERSTGKSYPKANTYMLSSTLLLSGTGISPEQLWGKISNPNYKYDKIPTTLYESLSKSSIKSMTKVR